MGMMGFTIIRKEEEEEEEYENKKHGYGYGGDGGNDWVNKVIYIAFSIQGNTEEILCIFVNKITLIA